MIWSTDEMKLQEQVNQVFKELGFEFPTTVEQVDQFNEAFKDYPYENDLDHIDVDKILKSAGVID